ncbi:MAG: hypothetical protein ABIN91_23945 [Mucilaginibacter sp.]|uniref:hypothetical protein n=1 Tax=Mucilaginibacter sp. TaxID=1882438 RepID=UPI0032664EAE
MKKYLLLLLSLIVILNSCTKLEGTVINGANSGASATYQPLTAGSTWKYRTDYTASVGYTLLDTSVITMSAKTSTINSRLYTQAYETRSGFGIADTGYYYTSNHGYSIMQTIPAGTSSYTLELLYLKDNVAVGTTWTSSLNYPSMGTVTLNGKITEKNISKTVLGKTYTKVIHSTLNLQMTIFGAPYPITYEIYVAQGIGIIHIDLIQPGTPPVQQDLVSYTIK